MAKRAIALVGLSVLALLALSLLAFPDERDWKIAVWKDSLASYSTYLDQHPQGKYAVAAATTLRARTDEEAWAALGSTPAAASLAAFVKANPDSSKLKEAQARLRPLLLRAAAERFAATRTTDRSVDDLTDLSTRALVEKPSTPQNYQLALDVLTLFVSDPRAETFRTSFPGWKPSPASTQDWLRSGAKAVNRRMRFVKTNNPIQGTVETLVAAYVPIGRSPINAVYEIRGQWSFTSRSNRMLTILDAVMAQQQGDSLDYAAQRRPFTGAVAINGQNLFTELPNERIYVTPFMMDYVGLERGGFMSSDPEVFIPDGPGSVFRIQGKVSGLPAVKLDGDANYPLAFVLLTDHGLFER